MEKPPLGPNNEGCVHSVFTTIGLTELAMLVNFATGVITDGDPVATMWLYDARS